MAFNVGILVHRDGMHLWNFGQWGVDVMWWNAPVKFWLGGKCNVMECTSEILARGVGVTWWNAPVKFWLEGMCNVMECICEILARGEVNLVK